MIDAHIHLWDPRVTPRIVSPAVKLLGWNPDLLKRMAGALFPASSLDFVGKPDEVIVPYLPGKWLGDTLAAPSGPTWDRPAVEGFVHVEASWQTGGKALGEVDETRWLEEVCGQDLLGIVGAATLEADNVEELVAAHRGASRRFVGVRDKLASSSQKGVEDWKKTLHAPMRNAAWRRGFERLGELDVAFDAWVYGEQLRELTEVCRSTPSTRVVLDHLGTPVALGGPVAGLGRTEAERTDIAKRWHDDLARLAELPHVYAKVSGLTMPIVGWDFHERTAPPSVLEVVDRLGQHIVHALQCFGPERCIIASNFPMDRVSVRWSTWMAALQKLLEGESAEVRANLFGGNARRFYRLDSVSNEIE
ncbi:MAG: amidohydrolase family protein [Myxococcota bacterium]